MARNRKRKSLYEVMSKTRHKSSFGKMLEWLHPQEQDKVQSADEKAKATTPESKAQWWKRPKIIQINAGRIELSMPYQLAIAILLGLILLILVAFRLGQINQKVANSSAKIQKGSLINQNERDMVKTMQAGVSTEDISPSIGKIESAQPTGNNRIVIQTFQVRSQLEQVNFFFAQNGIETEIKTIGNMYYLVTSNKYENPNRPGTNGYRAKQIIVEVGAKYQALPGYETFAPHFFRDAYGMKFED